MSEDQIYEYMVDEAFAFEFNNLDYVEDFHLIKELLTNHKAAKVVDIIEGPSARIAMLKVDGLKFDLIYNSDLGNALVIRSSDPRLQASVREIARDVYAIYRKIYAERP